MNQKDNIFYSLLHSVQTPIPFDHSNYNSPTMIRVSGLLSLFALGAIVTAAPQLLSNAPKSVSTSDTAPTVTALATTSAAIIAPSSTAAAAPVSASQIAIPDSVIDAAPIHDISTDNTLVSIPGIVSNSTLINARPDLQEYVNSANVTGNSTAAHKRDLVRSC